MDGKKIWTSILLIVLFGVARVALHLIRLIILAALGLLALYLLRSLAHEFNRIRNPPKRSRGFLGGLVKRSPEDTLPHDPEENSWWARLSSKANLSSLVKEDGSGCARKYVCHLSSLDDGRLSQLQKSMLSIIRIFKGSDNGHEWETAEKLGRSLGAKSPSTLLEKSQNVSVGKEPPPGNCQQKYPACRFTVGQLERIVKNFH